MYNYGLIRRGNYITGIASLKILDPTLKVSVRISTFDGTYFCYIDANSFGLFI